MEADLSEHLGRFGEFFIGLFGLTLLLLMHPEIRRSAATRLRRLSRSIARLHRHLDAKSFTYRNWSAAFRLIIREKRDLLLILFALIALEYFADFYDWLIEKFVIARLYDRAAVADATWEEIMHISFLHSYSMSGVIYIGYALFGWLAYQRAQGTDYKKAASFRSPLKLLGFALMLIGLSTLTDHLSPWAVTSISLAKDSAYLLYLMGVLSGGLLLLLLGARIFNSLEGWKIQKSAVAAGSGFLALTLAKYWLYHALWIAMPSARPSWAAEAQAILAEFSGAALQSIILLGFAIVLAAPAPSNNPANAV